MPCLMLEFIIRIENRQKAFPHFGAGTLLFDGTVAVSGNIDINRAYVPRISREGVVCIKATRNVLNL